MSILKLLIHYNLCSVSQKCSEIVHFPFNFKLLVMHTTIQKFGVIKILMRTRGEFI